MMREFLVLPVVCLLFACTQQPRAVSSKPPAVQPPSQDADALQDPPPTVESAPPAVVEDASFEPVKIMLAAKCAPCHIPGGKMYDRLPWDNPEVVRSHADGITRRLKSEEDLQTLQRWLK